MRGILRIAKRLVKAVLGKDVFVLPDSMYVTKRFGSVYGGWSIVPSEVGAAAVVYSFGVGEDASFDIEMITELGLKVHAFDPTPKSIEWVRRQAFPAEFIMHEIGLAGYDGNATFRPPENPDYVSHTMLDRPATDARSIVVPVRRLATIMQDLGHAQVDILKMDIEGAEYEVLDDMALSTVRPRQLLVEFHHRFPGVGVQKTTRAIRQLRGMGYKLVCVSPTAEEYSFLFAPTQAAGKRMAA